MKNYVQGNRRVVIKNEKEVGDLILNLDTSGERVWCVVVTIFDVCVCVCFFLNITRSKLNINFKLFSYFLRINTNFVLIIIYTGKLILKLKLLKYKIS